MSYFDTTAADAIDNIETRHRKCAICGSVWAAYTTLEAYNNYFRRERLHPETMCQDGRGEFGPALSRGLGK